MLVYIALNKINGKVYVGKTARALSFRKAEHFSAAKKGSVAYFHNALRKHGIDNFEWSVIHDDVNSEEILNQSEKATILLYKSNNKNYGYNLTSGGDGVCGFQARLGKVHSDATKAKMSKARMGRSAWNKGFKGKCSQETIDKMSKAAKNRDCFTKNKIAISRGSREFLVFKKDTGEFVGSWINKSECVKTLGLYESAVSGCLLGNRHSANGYCFRYVEV